MQYLFPSSTPVVRMHGTIHAAAVRHSADIRVRNLVLPYSSLTNARTRPASVRTCGSSAWPSPPDVDVRDIAHRHPRPFRAIVDAKRADPATPSRVADDRDRRPARPWTHAHSAIRGWGRGASGRATRLLVVATTMTVSRLRGSYRERGATAQPEGDTETGHPCLVHVARTFGRQNPVRSRSVLLWAGGYPATASRRCVVIEAEHQGLSLRGVRAHGSRTLTSALQGPATTRRRQPPGILRPGPRHLAPRTSQKGTSMTTSGHVRDPRRRPRVGQTAEALRDGCAFLSSSQRPYSYNC